ncbi:MAG TPA: hypothetical protein VJ810_19120 [Blastocatellia bacterium]|nr:hypothetical protein [Blastocatellia bacterium]
MNIAAPNLLGLVAHDTTLGGSGTISAPLKIALPLFLVIRVLLRHFSLPTLISDRLYTIATPSTIGNGVKLRLGSWISLTISHRPLPIDLQGEELEIDLTAKQWAM